MAQLSEAKSNPRPKMKENVKILKCNPNIFCTVHTAHPSETDFDTVIVEYLHHFC